MGTDGNITKDKATANINAAESQETSFIRIKDQLIEKARGFNLLSNVFMSVALNDILACQHVIRVITGNPDLIVKEIRSQYRISKVTAHDAVLDILAEDSHRRLVNLEIQRKDTIDHARRTRFYAAMIDSECLEKGKDYHEMPDVHMIYISETDLWKAGKTMYEVEKRFKGTEITYEDGIHVTYVNAEIEDGTEVSQLMKYFKTTDPEDMSQGELSKRIHFLKCEEGGLKVMCEMSEKWIEEGRAEGEERKAKEVVFSLADRGMSAENIADIVKMNIAIVEQWLEGRAAAR